MCLSIAIDRPDDVLATGVHNGHQWVVTSNGGGFRCGYVRVPKGHPWHGNSWDDFEEYPLVHGGITFGEGDVQCDQPGDDDAWWVGFDCAHGFDSPDPLLMDLKTKTWRAEMNSRFPDNGTVRSQEYAEAECRSLCEQAWKVVHGQS